MTSWSLKCPLVCSYRLGTPGGNWPTDTRALASIKLWYSSQPGSRTPASSIEYSTRTAAKSNSARMFFDVYGSSFASGRVLDIGAQDVNGSLREVCPPQFSYVGVDFLSLIHI